MPGNRCDPADAEVTFAEDQPSLRDGPVRVTDVQPAADGSADTLLYLDAAPPLRLPGSIDVTPGGRLTVTPSATGRALRDDDGNLVAFVGNNDPSSITDLGAATRDAPAEVDLAGLAVRLEPGCVHVRPHAFPDSCGDIGLQFFDVVLADDQVIPVGATAEVELPDGRRATVANRGISIRRDDLADNDIPCADLFGTRFDVRYSVQPE